jgi:hypothetical protein
VRNGIRHFSGLRIPNFGIRSPEKWRIPFLTPLGSAYGILWKYNNSCLENGGFWSKLFLSFDQLLLDGFCFFCFFFCILVLIPYLILRFMTFTQKSEFLCDMIFFNIFYTLVRFTTVKLTTVVAQLSISVHISEQQWLLRRTLRYNVFVTIVSIPYGILTIVTIIYTVYINYVQTMLIHVNSFYSHITIMLK